MLRILLKPERRVERSVFPPFSKVLKDHCRTEDIPIGQPANPDELPAQLFRQWEQLFAIATGVTGEGKPLDAKGRNALARIVGRTLYPARAPTSPEGLIYG
mgnify:CR=1 FL=1